MLLDSALRPNVCTCDTCGDQLLRAEQEMLAHAREHVLSWITRALTAEAEAEQLRRDLAALRARL